MPLALATTLQLHHHLQLHHFALAPPLTLAPHHHLHLLHLHYHHLHLHLQHACCTCTSTTTSCTCTYWGVALHKCMASGEKMQFEGENGGSGSLHLLQTESTLLKKDILEATKMHPTPLNRADTMKQNSGCQPWWTLRKKFCHRKKNKETKPSGKNNNEHARFPCFLWGEKLETYAENVQTF